MEAFKGEQDVGAAVEHAWFLGEFFFPVQQLPPHLGSAARWATAPAGPRETALDAEAARSRHGWAAAMSVMFRHRNIRQACPPAWVGRVSPVCSTVSMVFMPKVLISWATPGR